MALGAPGMITQQLRRDVARRFQKIEIFFQVGEAQHRHAALARAQVLAGTAQPQISLGNAKPIRRFFQRPQALVRLLALGGGHQNAVGVVRAASDASTVTAK